MICANWIRPATTAAAGALLALTLAGCASGGGSGAGPAPADSDQATLHTEAVAAVAGGNAQRAEVLFRQLTDQYPRYATPWLNLALLRYRRGDLRTAQQALDEALQRDSNMAPAWNLQGVLAREAEDIDAAESHYRQAIAVDPGYAPAWLNLGILQEIWQGQLSAALASYRRYQELAEPGAVDPRVAGWIADLQRRLDRGA